jgi:hypothetical protein
MFDTYNIKNAKNYFTDLSNSIEFEDVGKGRKSRILVDPDQNRNVPLVRTTSQSEKSSQLFPLVIYEIIDEIRKTTKNQNLSFNNIWAEQYTTEYCKMGEHTDQMQDLATNSYICVFSCYNNPNTKSKRKLMVKNKKEDTWKSVTMEHNSIILFSTDTNKKHVHKIIMDGAKSDDLWIGLTFRLSKTSISFVNNVPHISGQVLKLATDDDKKLFFSERKTENSTIEHKWPSFNFTVNPGDLIPIIKTKKQKTFWENWEKVILNMLVFITMVFIIGFVVTNTCIC